MSNVLRFKPEAKSETKAVDAEAFRTDIIRPALNLTGLWSPSAENLILGTALVESGLNVFKQRGGGPALSVYQVEPATYVSITKYLLARQFQLRTAILTACYLETFPEASAMIWNLRLATLIARCVYYRRQEPLPESTDVIAMAHMWKQLYNTPLGAGKVEDYIKAWEAHQ